MKPLLLTTLAVTLVALSASVAAAGPCGPAATPKVQADAARVMALIRPHACCQSTLDKCLTEQPSRLVARLAAEVCRQVGAGKPDNAIVKAFAQRAESMLGTGKPAAIALDGLAWAGDPKAPVTLVAYMCARCPYCATSAPLMHRAVTSGALKGKARLAMKPFPLRGHEGAAEGGLAFEAARELGKFWPYVLKVFADFDAFSVDNLVVWATAVGLETAAFEATMAAPATRKALLVTKKEGMRGGVGWTPTYFVSGKRYTADMGAAAMIDAVLEEVDRVEGTLCKP